MLSMDAVSRRGLLCDVRGFGQVSSVGGKLEISGTVVPGNRPLVLGSGRASLAIKLPVATTTRRGLFDDTAVDVGWFSPLAQAVGWLDADLMAPVLSAAVGIATETDTAFALGSVKIRPIGLATETDTAFALVAAKALSVGMATETDTAFALAGALVAAARRRIHIT